ncbi:MAG TPA: ImcF-related family protein [Candidatus Polarisedimenticolia bacterium]|nr:ImcF-related family protein [Candidatus Polarisedimenticolia bacterium]
MVYLATGVILLAYLVLVWFLGGWLRLRGSDIWVLRGGLAFVGLIAAGSFLWFYRKSKADEADTETQSAQVPGTDDIDLVVREAVRRLKSSTLGRGANLGNLPLVFVLGDSGATKTTTVIHSALDPELLAGHVYQDTTVLPTRLLNIWYTRQAIFVDPAGELLTQPSRWKRLVKLVQPGRVSTAMGKGLQAPRAAIVCYDTESFLKPGASETTISAARKLAVRLHEISQLLGISFPVYVLFTKLDRLSFFPEFVRGLNKAEASEVLGTTLPVRSLATGVYEEEETRRLGKAFDELFYSLAERRLDLLARENDGSQLPAIYEFPRELRKLRTLLVQFLVDLTRPSQLSVNPFLRGFYFSGVRPVMVDDVAVAGSQMQSADLSSSADATRIFSSTGFSSTPSPLPSRASGSRKVPQWVFLSQFFNDIIVKDRVALAASGFSSRVSLLRRVALTAVSLIAMVCAIGFLVSFVGNHQLQSDVRGAVNELRTTQGGVNDVPSLASLQKLERLHQHVSTLAQYETDGVPLRLRWGLYIGDRLYPDARSAYFERFRQLLFAYTQGKLLDGLRAVPDTPGPNDSYEKTYNELKAYLITTGNNDRSTKEFLSPVLTSHWTAGRDIDADRLGLAKTQFDFYSTELAMANPFSATNDGRAIARSRIYLSQFAGIDRFYLPLLAKATPKNPDVSFNEQFRDSLGVIVSNHKVRGAFTRNGFIYVQDAIRNPSFMSVEEWVLGKTTASELDPATLQQKLTERYYDDFTKEWRTVLQTSSVIRYQDSNDAEKKLEKLTGATSPLLELFWFISNNTAVSAPDLAAPFLPVQALEPPGAPDKLPDQYILPSNKDYILALSKLQADIAPLVNNPTDPALASQVSTSEGAAKVSVTQVMGTRVDQKFHNENLVRALLEQPITNIDDIVKGIPAKGVNQAGQKFCDHFSAIATKYPFNPKSDQDLTVDQLNDVLAPKTGALWTFYDDKLKQILVKQGSHYEVASASTVKPTPAFVAFFNRAAALSDALYPGGSSTPKFSYTLKTLPSNLEGVELRIGNETLTENGQQKTFTWTGTPEEVQATAKGGLILGNPYKGPWAIFRFVSEAHSQGSGAVTNLEWIIQSNGKNITLPNGKPESYSYQLHVDGINPFQAGELAGLRCISTVAH